MADSAYLANLCKLVKPKALVYVLHLTMADIKDGNSTVTVASKVPFAELCGLLEKVSKTQGNDKKKRILKDFIEKWRESHSTLHADNKDVVSKSLCVFF